MFGNIFDSIITWKLIGRSIKDLFSKKEKAPTGIAPGTLCAFWDYDIKRFVVSKYDKERKEAVFRHLPEHGVPYLNAKPLPKGMEKQFKIFIKELK